MTEPVQPALPGESVEINPQPRRLRDIAREIRQDWAKVNFAAAPYLDAMSTLTSVQDNYFQDSGTSIVRYFLANAGSWRGEKARSIKAELKAMVA
jgi:hypothetical protein